MECRDFYKRKLEQELQRKDLVIISLENLLEALEKSIAEIKDKKESTPYRTVEDECNVLLLSLSKEKEKIEREIEKRLSSLAPLATNMLGYRILAKMLSHSGSLKALAFMPASRIQVLGAEKGLFSGTKTPKHGYIFQHPSVKGAERKERGKQARRLACRLVIALRADYFSMDCPYGEERLKISKAKTGNESKLFYLFELHPEIKEDFKGTVLYLGAGSGSTAKRLAGISERLYCVEFAPLPFASLLEVAKKEERICPIMESADEPERYSPFVIKPDIIYQDITQKNQVDIFLKNLRFFSAEKGILMVKASSIDARRTADTVFAECADRLLSAGYSAELVDLRTEFRNHAALISKKL
jgi:fibrillarin-like rRNA methylase